MSDPYKPKTLDALAERGFKTIQDAYNSGYILGNENAEARFIKLLEDPDWSLLCTETLECDYRRRTNSSTCGCDDFRECLLEKTE